jgi:hypothetical protein
LVSADTVAEFNENGFAVFRGVLGDERVSLEQSIARCYALQALKIVALRDAFPKDDPVELDTVDDLDRAIDALETVDKEAAYQALPLIAQSPGGRTFANSDVIADVASTLMGCPRELVLVGPPSPFVNRPRSRRLLYRWHSEAHYYPKRRNFLNLWAPLYRPKNTDNGTMWFAVGSHKLVDLPFVEYQGYDDETFGKRNHFVQYEVPASFISDCEKVAVQAEPGDLVAFHRSTVHTSSENPSDTTSYAVVCRAWEPRGDLTLSGNLAATPYGGDYGRPGLDTIN